MVPEIDIPGHSTAMLVALPELVDGQEAPDSYRSVQGYPNNALNPAIEYTYEVLGKVFDDNTPLKPRAERLPLRDLEPQNAHGNPHAHELGLGSHGDDERVGTDPAPAAAESKAE